MSHTVLKIKTHVSWNFVSATALALLLMVCAGYSPLQAAVKGVQQKTYSSPEDAVKAFVDAVKVRRHKTNEYCSWPKQQGHYIVR